MRCSAPLPLVCERGEGEEAAAPMLRERARRRRPDAACDAGRHVWRRRTGPRGGGAPAPRRGGLVCVDRDGVINVDVGAPGVLRREDLRLEDGSAEALAALSRAGHDGAPRARARGPAVDRAAHD